MGIQDIIITPVWFFILLIAAYVVRPLVTNKETKPYFIPGLMAKFVGAIALGLTYQFYYGGGDTFTFHTHGSRWIWQAFMDEPFTGIQLFLQQPGDFNGETFAYSSKIWMFRDAASWFVIKIAAFFDLFTFSTYSATALFFASFAFSGHWILFHLFQRLYPNKTGYLALTCLFVPSVIFWGSGILKDSVTLAALCWMTYALFQIAIWRKNIVLCFFLLLFFGWIVYSIKIYILLCFLVTASLFLYKRYVLLIKTPTLRLFLTPFILALFIGVGYFMMQKISEGDSKYALENIGQTAMITAYDIRYGWGARHGDNSGYTLGELDGSIGNLVALAPQGVVVTLFRPWLWEVRNPLMLLAALESLSLLLLTSLALIKLKWRNFWSIINKPPVLFCLTFALFFAFAVGVSTYNFGTLMRYKIPVMPFYLIVIFLLLSSKTSEVNVNDY
ncbi:hypothetical protein [Reichenbachiella sp.]